MNQEKINKELRDKDCDSSEFQRKVIESVRKWMKASANKMSTYHSGWDANSYIYRGYRVEDKEDRDSKKEGTPAKVIVPLTYAQIQTAISFILSTYTQRDNMLELRGRGPEDEKNSFAVTTDLSYQLNREKFVLKLYFWLLDALKQGFGVVRVEWVEDYAKMRVAQQVPDYSIGNALGAIFGKSIPTKTQESVQSVLSYQGCKITNISPYAFYPDPSVNLANFQEGMFVFTEQEVALVSLTSKEGEMYYGTEKIPDSMPAELYKERARRVSGPFNDENGVNDGITEKNAKNDKALLLEGEVSLSEKAASEMWGVKLGSGTEPVKWLIAIANDQKVIRFESKGYLHNRFCCEMFEFSPDHDSFFNPGLADTISELQTINTFFLNSHIVNVKKIIANRFVGDPSKVEMDDVNNGSMFIRTKGAQGDINRCLKQLEVSDVTSGHVKDMEVLTALVQMITGVNENALGQYSAGRRSATEARNVNAGAAARLKMHATLAWLQGIEPLGRQILSNTRQWRTKNVYDYIVGAEALDAPFEVAIIADPEKLAGGYDFVPYDATLPTDRQFQAGVLQELFGVMMSNPNAMQLINKDPMKLLDHIAKLYNIKNLRDFDLQPLPLPPVTQVVPDQQAADAAGAGAAPIDVAGEGVLAGLQG
jgi:hypothetical protein